MWVYPLNHRPTDTSCWYWCVTYRDNWYVYKYDTVNNRTTYVNSWWWSYTSSDIIGCGIDVTNQKAYFRKNWKYLWNIDLWSAYITDETDNIWVFWAIFGRDWVDTINIKIYSKDMTYPVPAWFTALWEK